MTDINPTPSWANVRQLETNEFATGGANGNMNEQAKSLAARSELLKQYAALPYESKTGGYALNERVQLATGDIVRSTITSNVNNPNENMTGWVKANDASQIFDESGKSQQQVNNKGIKDYSASLTYAENSVVVKDGVLQQWKGGVWVQLNKADAILDASGKTQQEINDQKFVNVKDYLSKSQLMDCLTPSPTLKYSDAFQAAVNDAIVNGSNSIFIPFDRGERYVLDKTVNIPASGFAILGNRTPSYHIHLRGGRITADAGVTEFFNYGVGGTYDSNQFSVDGIAALGQGGNVQTLFKHDANNNGPHRGVSIRNCSGREFNNIILLDPTNPAYLSAANLNIDSSCCFAGNNNVVNAAQRLFGLRVVGIQSEQGARYTGAIDGGVTFEDNMLEGQSDPITIDSNQPSVILQNNYYELISGNYLSSTKGTNVNAIFDERPNYISSITAIDIHRLGGVVRLHAPYRFNLRDDRHSLYSLINCNLATGSKFDGAAYVGTTGSTDDAVGFCDPMALKPARTTAKFNKFVGTDVLDTPTGKTYTGLKSTGTTAYIAINSAGWAIGDVVTAVALVKIPRGEAINMSVYGSAGELVGAVGQNTMSKMAEGWHIVFISIASSVASTSTRFRFTSTSQIEIAAVGVDVTPVADFKTFNAVQRAEIQLFNPLPLNIETYTYKDVRTLTIPAIAAGASYTTTSIGVFGSAIGDAVISTPNVDMLGLDWFARVSAAHTIELRIVNRTAASVTLGSVQWNTRVFK